MKDQTASLYEGESRELVVTVRLRYPLAKIVAQYPDAITPDGGFTGTVNAWIEDYAQGFIEEMEGCSVGNPDATFEHGWELRDA